MSNEYIVVPASLNEGVRDEVFLESEELLTEFEALLVNRAEDDNEFVKGWDKGVRACMKTLIGMRDKALYKT